MAKARMLHNKISKSLQVDNLPLPAQLLFTWMVSWADDEGRIRGEPKYIKGTVVPLKNWSLKNIRLYLEQMRDQNLIYFWGENNEEYIEFVKWGEHQQIRKDRLVKSLLPSVRKDNDNQLATNSQPDDNQETAEANISESNPIELNKSESNEVQPIAGENTSYKEGDSKDEDSNPTDGGNSKNGYVAFELVKRMEPGNLKALGLYISYARKIPHSLLFQWASEIEQDSTVKNRGALFNSKASNYLEIGSSGTGVRK